MPIVFHAPGRPGSARELALAVLVIAVLLAFAGAPAWAVGLLGTVGVALLIAGAGRGVEVSGSEARRAGMPSSPGLPERDPIEPEPAVRWGVLAGIALGLLIGLLQVGHLTRLAVGITPLRVVDATDAPAPPLRPGDDVLVDPRRLTPRTGQVVLFRERRLSEEPMLGTVQALGPDTLLGAGDRALVLPGADTTGLLGLRDSRWVVRPGAVALDVRDAVGAERARTVVVPAGAIRGTGVAVIGPLHHVRRLP